jgi:hypothetical protein
MQIKNLLAAALLGTVGLVLSVGTAGAAEPKKVEKKCDATGKECKSGKDCKAENCKK